MGLKLVTTEKFNGVDCNFYRNGTDAVMVTREQIGAALEYADPQKAIVNIHTRHKERLTQFSVTAKLWGMTGRK